MVEALRRLVRKARCRPLRPQQPLAIVWDFGRRAFAIIFPLPKPPRKRQ